MKVSSTLQLYTTDADDTILPSSLTPASGNSASFASLEALLAVALAEEESMDEEERWVLIFSVDFVLDVGDVDCIQFVLHLLVGVSRHKNWSSLHLRVNSDVVSCIGNIRKVS